MNRIVTVVALAALVALAAGCPGKTSTEMAKDALSPEAGLNATEVSEQLAEALIKSDEEIKEDPEAVEPYVSKASLLWVKGDFVGAVETLQTALDRAKPKSDAERERLKSFMITAYRRAGTPEMWQKGIRFVAKLIDDEGKKNLYCYAMGIYYRKLYQTLGDGVFKTEANRWFLECRLDEAVMEELSQEGLRDPLLK